MVGLNQVVDALLTPGHLLLILAALGSMALFTRWTRTGRVLVTIAVLGFAAILLTPVAGMGLRILEDRVPAPASLPGRVDGIIVLGGAIDQEVSATRPGMTFSGNAARLTGFLDLAKRYPDARLIFSGGGDEFREADLAEALFRSLGFDVARIEFERQSRTTYENVIFSKDLVDPKLDETWVLVTSAFHMPRAVGVFRRNEWPVIPYPVDFKTLGGDAPHWPADLYEGLTLADLAAHELLGLVYYWLADRTDSIFPGPDDHESSNTVR